MDLPPVLVSLLNSEQFTPAPRDEFKQQLDNIQLGQQITLSSIDQRPKHLWRGLPGTIVLYHRADDGDVAPAFQQQRPAD